MKCKTSKVKHTDFLVIGSGIAGLTFALKTANSSPDAKVIIVTKSDEDETNTKYAQGGLAVVTDLASDAFVNHIEDTLNAGDGLCNREVDEMVVKKGPELVAELIDWGVDFDHDQDGELRLAMEGGHSSKRVVHHKDKTGVAIEQALLGQLHSNPNIQMLSHHFVLDLITNQSHANGQRNGSQSTCYGATVLNQNSNHIQTIAARITLLASGGAGQVYKETTNPTIATGDGIAMAYRANAVIENMEFIQFHPTALYHKGRNPSFLISEAVRGYGAQLKTPGGELFMHNYDERGSLSPRDIVARAIDNEMKNESSDFVYLDCTSISDRKFKKRFPTISLKCNELGINVPKEMIPVIPAAHYLCGGIKTDKYGRTSIQNLYAAGECASTGLHGANRLASNSLLEAVVFADQCYKSSIKQIDNIRKPNVTPIAELNLKSKLLDGNTVVKIRWKLRRLMSSNVGIYRNNTRLMRASAALESLDKDVEHLFSSCAVTPNLCELRNLICIGKLIVQSAIERKENKGLHYNIDNVPNPVHLIQI